MLPFSTRPIIPAISAGLPGVTEATTTPLESLGEPSCWARFGVRFTPAIPNHGWSYLPSVIRYGTILATVFDGIAKPTPANSPVSDEIALLTPITLPCISNRGPPEFPGLIAASVWIISGIEKPISWFGSSRPTWLIMPFVMELLKAKGFPIAITCCPTSSWEELPSWREAVCSSEKSSVICNIARSLKGSVPITLAEYVLPLAKVTSTVLEPWMTWLFVIINPLAASWMNPEPRRACCWPSKGLPLMVGPTSLTALVICTTEFSTFLKIWLNTSLSALSIAKAVPLTVRPVVVFKEFSAVFVTGNGCWMFWTPTGLVFNWVTARLLPSWMTWIAKREARIMEIITRMIIPLCIFLYL